MTFANLYQSKPIKQQTRSTQRKALVNRWAQLTSTIKRTNAKLRKEKRKEKRYQLHKNGSGGNSHPISCTLRSKVYHLDECAEFLKKNTSGVKRLYQTERFMLSLLQL